MGIWVSPYNNVAENDADREQELSAGEVAYSNGGRRAKFIQDIDPDSFLFVLGDGPASRGGMFGFDRPEAEKLLYQLAGLLNKSVEPLS